MNEKLPILYSFRRCPYAMRARMALYYSGINCQLREVSLKNKPSALIDISPKATVPVMQLPCGTIIDESLDIIYYAINQNDPEGIDNFSANLRAQINELIASNDSLFASLLHKYKYFEKYPEGSQKAYRKQIEEGFLEKYEQMLERSEYLFGQKSIADIAILPFIRQFAFVDKEWFFGGKYKNLISWLNKTIESEVFDNIILAKHDPWKKGDDVVYFI
ncbi:MAG: glutathione S-transferase N-terminal domain-containing protein [Rickettsiaceae bacterium]|nr:glutathione S-transferase N-terminal domain-containing protein [Rickettsiaceae bacterium]